LKGIVFDVEEQIRASNRERELVIDNDKSRLLQCLMHIVSNALKFTDQGSVKVKARQIGKQFVEVVVKDTGCGIDDENKKLLFQMFAVAERQDFLTTHGIGRGLKFSKLVIEQLKGTLAVKSETNKGSSFYIRLPMSLDDQMVLSSCSMNEELPMDPRATQFTILKNENRTSHILKLLDTVMSESQNQSEILIVDDISLNCEVLKGIIESERVAT